MLECIKWVKRGWSYAAFSSRGGRLWSRQEEDAEARALCILCHCTPGSFVPSAWVGAHLDDLKRAVALRGATPEGAKERRPNSDRLCFRVSTVVHVASIWRIQIFDNSNRSALRADHLGPLTKEMAWVHDGTSASMAVWSNVASYPGRDH